jgi:hydrophobe/amphiphile efflux-1 (HAE1) family protein
MTITELSIKRPILLIVGFIILGGLGLFSYQQLKYELLPNLTTPFVTIVTIYPGASPKEVENSVTKKLEEGVTGVSKVKKVTSNSSENLSVITIEFLADTNADQATQEVQRAVSKVLSELPVGVKAPTIEKFNINDVPVLRLSCTAQMEETELYELLKNQIKPQLLQLKNIGRITLLGGVEKEIKISADKNKLQQYGISTFDLLEAVRRTNNDYPVGTIRDTDRQLGVRVAGKATTFEQIQNQEVKHLADGSSIKIKDVATVSVGKKETETISRLNGKSAIGLFVNKQSGSNGVEVSATVRKQLLKLEEEHKKFNLTFDVAQDSSEFTLEAANAVYKDFFIAVVLVALVMLVFLHSLRNSLVVMLAIPTSLFSAFVMMYLMDYSLNLMTLLAMSLVIGILVDDSIVVLENIYRHLEMGKDKVKASLDGRNEIGFAALSITLVDVVVFLPMALVPGLVGSLVKQFSLVIVVSTLSSLFVSFTLTPMIASRFAKLEHLSAKSFFGRIGLFFENNINRLIDFYAVILRWSLKHKLATLSIAFGLLVASFGLVGAGYVGAEFAPATDKGELSLLINMQPGTKLSETNEALLNIEKKLNQMPEVTKINTSVGFMSEGFGGTTNSNVASVNISFVPSNQRKKSLADLNREIKILAMQEPGVKARVSAIGLFGAGDAPIQILISGANRDSVLAMANTLLEKSVNINGIVSPRLSVEQGKPEMEVSIDRDKLGQLGLNIETVGAALRTSVNGNDEMKFIYNNTDVDIRVQLQQADRKSTQDITQLTFINNKGEAVYFDQFAKLNLKSSPTALDRRSKQPSVNFLCQVVGRPVGDVGEDIKQLVSTLQVPTGVKISYEGDLELQDDAFGKLGVALLSSFILIYLIMVALYNNWTYPFVVLFSIPVALVGAFLALALTAKSINVFSIFGLIMMMGLVAKNAILLVDRANDNRSDATQHFTLIEALVDAGRTRLRPILMTTLAMVIGMLPLALAKGAGAELNTGLAWVLIGGLTSSMFLTVLVVPVIYYGVTRLMERMSKPSRVQIQPAAVIFFLMLLPALSYAQEQKSYSLQQAIETGLANNPNMQLAQLEMLKAKFAHRQAQAELLPTVNVILNYNRNIKAPVFFFPSFGADPNTGALVIDDTRLQPLAGGLKNTYSNVANLNLNLYNHEVNQNIKYAKLGTQLAEANQEVSRWQLKDEIRKAYINVLIAQESAGLAQQTMLRSLQSLKDSRGLLARGVATDADTLNAWSNYTLMQNNVQKASISTEQAINFLKTLMGITLNENISLPESLNSLDAQLEAVNATQEVNINSRPDLNVNSWQRKMLLQQLSVDRARFLPSLSLIGQYQIQTQANDFKFNNYVWPNTFFMGLQLQIPIFNGLKSNLRVRQTQVAIRQAELQRQQTISQASLETSNARLSILDAENKMASQQRVLQAMNRSAELTKSRWQAGLVKYAEYADAELNLAQAKNSLNQAKYELLLAKFAYLKSTNQLQ